MTSTQQTSDEKLMAERLCTALALEGLNGADIVPDAPLFSSNDGGLGLDSIDALEIALMIQQQYGVELRSEDPETRPAFASLRALTAHILRRRSA